MNADLNQLVATVREMKEDAGKAVAMYAKECGRLRQQRDALLAAAEAVMQFHVFVDSIAAGRATGCKEAFEQLRAAIAMCKDKP